MLPSVGEWTVHRRSVGAKEEYMPLTCSTRALKNAKRIRALAPNIIPAKEPAAGYSSIVPLDILARLHKMSDQELAIGLKNRPELLDIAKKMHTAPVPTPSRASPSLETLP